MLSLYNLRRNLGGLHPRRDVNNSRLWGLLKNLRPIYAGWDLIRVGPDGDGGYLIPNDLEGVSGCISPGVSDMMEFELELANDFGIPSFLFDGSIKEAPKKHDLIKFTSKFIGSELNTDFASLRSVIQDLEQSDGDLILQMDIEGHELSALSSLSKSDLVRFRTIVIEFHRIQDWKNISFFELLVEPTLRVLLEHFDVVHIHPNNCDGVFYLGNKKIPRAIEVTFHNKLRRKIQPKFSVIPHELDKANTKEVPDLTLQF